MTAPSPTFDRAWQLFQNGQPRQAEEVCRRLLTSDPAHAPSLHLLGVLAHQSGRHDESIHWIRQAIALCANNAEFHYNLGVAQQVQGQLEEAAASYRQTLELEPSRAEAHNNLAHALMMLGRLDEALAHIEQALRLRPQYAEAHANRGELLRRQGRLEDAVGYYRRALELEPSSTLFLVNLANVLTAQGQPEEAVPYYRRAIRLQPAEAIYLSNLGNALTLSGRPDESERCCRQALRLKPDFADAYHNLGIALGAQGEIEQALAANAEALRLNPDHVGARNCQAMWRLQMGDFARGWEEYEWRWKKPNMLPRNFPQPLWDGSSLEGRTILIHAEQGLGDTIQFIRYAPVAKRRGGTVIVECQPALCQLLAGCSGIDRLIAQGSPLPTFDVHVPLLSLPRIFGTTLADVPAEVQYLFADPALIERWRDELSGVPGFKIGIAWQGNPRFPADCMRSIPLTHFAPLAQVDGVRLFSLQKGLGREQLAATASYLPVIDLADRLDEKTGGFMDTAAVMKNLDLIITSDTAIPHLAGALGVPVWVCLALGADWRYLLGREDSPWYPTMRLFRQTRLGDWDGVFERIASELRSSGIRPPRPRPLRVEISSGELIDKITILEIKSQRIHDVAKLNNVHTELEVLMEVYDRDLRPSKQLTALSDELRRVNEMLWTVEDELRQCERDQDFGPRFVELARSVYRHNDRRSVLKRQINELLGSRILEEKSYTGS
jgi:tetratricopeptide (TPR) repeat protein